MCTLNCSNESGPYDLACQAPVGAGICGETKTLHIINEFKRLYEEKMHQIDVQSAGDHMEQKLKLQQEWIGDLTEQNEMLVKAVEELEYEATERVQLLEDKLQQSAKCICEVMKKYREHDVTDDLLREPLQKLFYLENDQKNLLEFIRRIRERQDWSLNGLKFYDVSQNDLLGESNAANNYLMKSDDKLNKAPLEAEKSAIQKETEVCDLKCKIDHLNSFGDVENMSKELAHKREECEVIKQSMMDMREVLTEEVASKHDMMLAIKRDCLELEERCQQADKQLAFKDDIIKELRKEIKQLKVQVTQDEVGKLNATIHELKDNLQSCKSEKDDEVKDSNSSTVSNSKDNATEMTELEKQLTTISNKEEIIKIQNETINILNIELQALREKNLEIQSERDKRCHNVLLYKSKISELEDALQESQSRACNLQSAIDHNLNSINVLEASEERSRIQLEQQKMTIVNLQEALVIVKQELEDLRHKTEENITEQSGTISILYVLLLDSDEDKQIVQRYLDEVVEQYNYLQNSKYDLEVEYCNRIQDIAILDGLVSKYQSILKSAEAENVSLKFHREQIQKMNEGCKKMARIYQNELDKCGCAIKQLDTEMQNIHDVGAKENAKLNATLSAVQTRHDILVKKLSTAEQKVKLEKDLNEARLVRLHEIIGEKDLSLKKHDQAIAGIRNSLQTTLQQNKELQATITELNETIDQMQNALKRYETDHCRWKDNVKTCKSQTSTCEKRLAELTVDLDKKTSELRKMETAYNCQYKTLQSTQSELHELKEKQKEKKCVMQCHIDELADRLIESDRKHMEMSDKFESVQKQLAGVARREAVKDMEVKRYQKIFAEIRTMLEDLNKTLFNKNLKKNWHSEECQKNLQLIDQSNEENFVHCQCEIDMYKDMIEALGKSIVDLKKQLSDTTSKLEKQTDDANTEKELLQIKLTAALNKAQKDDLRYKEMSRNFEQELAKIRRELHEASFSQQNVSSSTCLQLQCAQEELGSVKCELNRVLKKQYNLNQENEKLHNQSVQLQSNLSTMEQRSHMMKEQLDEHLMQLRHLEKEKEHLLQKNRELLSELRSIQYSYGSMNRQHRYTNDSFKHLEAELDDVRANREEICDESKNVVNYVRAWLQEQRRINEHIARKERDYCDAIRKLREENESLSSSSQGLKSSMKKPSSSKYQTQPRATVTCQSPYSLGSHGSGQEYESPCGSPSRNDWYASNFRNDETDDEDDEYTSNSEKHFACVVDNIAAGVEDEKKMWQAGRNRDKMTNSESCVSRDMKK